MGSMCADSCRLTRCVNIEIDGREIDVHVVEVIERETCIGSMCPFARKISIT